MFKRILRKVSVTAVAAWTCGLQVPTTASAADENDPPLPLTDVSTAAALALVAADDPAQSPTEKADAAPKLEDILVTGSRIQRPGFEAPTPLTVVGRDEIDATAPQNVADFVNKMPSVFGSLAPTTGISGGPASSILGLNGINLRGLGVNRTLILLDGHRSVPSTLANVIDVNEFPQQLISRVDIVTGGASSAYGSDAVSGVVNFVLDKNFVGTKLDVEGGQTTYGDDRNWKIAVSKGFEFAEGRAHWLLSGEINNKDGVFGIPRDWASRGIYMISNPAYAPGNGQPQLLVTSNTSLSAVTYGGIIVNTSLAGTAFGPSGAPYRFNYGAVSGQFMQGGEWRTNQFTDRTTLDPSEDRKNVFSRFSFAFSDHVEAYAQVFHGRTESEAFSAPQLDYGDIVVKSGNPFIPAAVQSQVTALGIQSFNIGSMNFDLLPGYGGTYTRTVNRYEAGANGSFGFLGRDWDWDTYYETGRSNEFDHTYTRNRANFFGAIDAVLDPNTGAIVCRSTLTNPTDGCVPYNPMGIGVNSQAAIDYVMGITELDQDIRQNTAAANLRGDIFRTWAGPVSLATGIEYRKQKVSGRVNALAAARGAYQANYVPTFGELTVKEAYIETVVPLAKGLPGARSLELNGAARYTDYSISGGVTTWKAGLVYSPIDDLRLRTTRSRDIRAPNPGELFPLGLDGFSGVTNPFNNNQSVTVNFRTNVGNPNLVPEKADTLGIGMVYQPSWARRLNASIDYYTIEIDNAIGTLGLQDIVNRCFDGNQQACSAITFNGNDIQRILQGQFNFITQKARGLDLELSYALDLHDLFSAGRGRLSFRALATHYLENLSAGRDNAGSNAFGPPNWIYRGSMAYDSGPLTLTVTGRGVSAGVNNTTYIECAADCPATTAAHPTINDNHTPGAFYLDASAAYKFSFNDGADAQIFFGVQNLFNKDPALFGYLGPSATAPLFPPANAAVYDVLGRTFQAGVRVRM